MKYFLPLIVVLFVFSGCDKTRIKELENNTAELRRQVESTQNDLATQNQYIDEITQSINHVYDNMQKISEGEAMISKSTSELEMGKGASGVQLREHIINQIAGIDTYLVENKRKLDDLDSKLKSSKAQYAGLKKMVNNLKDELVEKEHSIALLQDNLKELNIHVASLHDTITQKDMVVQVKDQMISLQKKEINSAFYTAGKASDLQDKGLIKREGGFPFGWFGKTSTLASGVSNNDFVPIDRYEQTTINVEGKVDEIIPKRNENLYAINEEGGSTKIQVLDPEKFWQEKYLVIVTK